MEKYPQLPPVRNVESEARHRKEVLWQITIPLIGIFLAAIGACLLPVIVVAQGGAVGKWADISTIWLVSGSMIGGLFQLVLVGALAAGVTMLVMKLPAGMFKVQQFFWKVQGLVEGLAARSVEPVLRVRSFSARLDALKAWLKSLAGGKNSGGGF